MNQLHEYLSDQGFRQSEQGYEKSLTDGFLLKVISTQNTVELFHEPTQEVVLADDFGNLDSLVRVLGQLALFLPQTAHRCRCGEPLTKYEARTTKGQLLFVYRCDSSCDRVHLTKPVLN